MARQTAMTRQEAMWCPVCRAELGVPPGHRPVRGQHEPPSLSLRLELCLTEDDGTRHWRLSAFHQPWSRQSPGFREADVRRVYHLCGDGHIFLHQVRVHGAPDPGWECHEMNLVAAVGGVATGKSFLLIRTLSQQLTVPGPAITPLQEGPLQVDQLPNDRLEDAPGTLLEADYYHTRVESRWLPITERDALLPANLLSSEVSPDLVEAIRDAQRDPQLLGEQHMRTNWGRRIRQPIVLRTVIGGHQVWTGVADLAGESFDHSNQHDEDQQALLRNFGSLLWVVDPVVTQALGRPLARALGDTSAVPASMRLTTTDEATVRTTRSKREQHQDALGKRLARLGEMAGEQGGTLRMCVVITKCDLLEYIMRTELDLAKLGQQNAVRDGVVRYLDYVATRSDRQGTRTLSISAAAEPHVRYFREPGPPLRRARLYQVADAVVDHYSDAAQFWELVHEGHRRSVLPVPAGENNTLPRRNIDVPSLDEHIVASLRKDEGEVLQLRDMIMSALGCGVMYGLGYANHLEPMLRHTWRDVRFFLCSPLTTVPVKLDDSADRIAPKEEEQFPLLHARSAGLSHLLLSILRGART